VCDANIDVFPYYQVHFFEALTLVLVFAYFFQTHFHLHSKILYICALKSSSRQFCQQARESAAREVDRPGRRPGPPAASGPGGLSAGQVHLGPCQAHPDPRNGQVYLRDAHPQQHLSGHHKQGTVGCPEGPGLEERSGDQGE